MMADYGAGAATGTLAYNEDALPAEYHGNLFLADFGKRNILRVRVERQGATYRAVSRQDLFTNVPPDFRPVGICLAPDGKSIYICDWQHVDTKEEVEVGRLLKLSYEGKTQAKPKPPWYVPAATGKPFDAITVDLVAGLSHPSREVRMVAQRRLAEWRDAEESLARLAEDPAQAPLARAHALWALSSPAVARRLAKEDSPLIRRQAVRFLSRHLDASCLDTLRDALGDEEASVRFQAVTGLGRTGDPDTIRPVLSTLTDEDDWVRYAASTALNRIGRRHSSAWSLMSDFLGDPGPYGVLDYAMRDTYDPALVEAVAAFARHQESPAHVRVAAIRVLAPLHHKLPEWKGEWWAYHPALAPPPRKTEAWAGTEAVLTALKKGLDDADRDVRAAALGGLREAGDGGAAPKIRELFSKGDAETKRLAMEALATCDDGRSAAMLLAYLDESQADAGLVGPVLLTLGRLKSGDAIPALAKHARSPAADVRDAAFGALVAVGGEAAKEAVVKLMGDSSVEVRAGAVRAAGEMGDRALVPKLLEAYQSPRTSAAAIAALARMPDARAVEPYLEGLASGDFAVRERCRGALAEVRDAALPAVENAVAAGGLSDDVVLELQRVYKGHEKASGGPLMALEVRRKHPAEYVEFAVGHAGDATRGEKLFAETTAGVLGCATCHAVRGRGGSVGPDLSGVGAKYSRRELAESIVFPSKVVREGYQQVTVRTKSGQVYSGPIKANTGQELTLHEADGTLRRIPAGEVAVRKDTGLSPMPENLHAGLTPEQFTDLVDYLESLKTETQEK
jgi:putative heme-binding domain-containing protein